MSKKAVSGWKKAVIFNPANGDRVQVNKISPAESELPADPNIKTESATGSVFGGRQWPVRVGFLDSDGLALLDTWTAGNTPANLVVFSPAGFHLLFYENETPFFRHGIGIDARTGLPVHQVEIEAIGGLPDVQQVKNLAKAIEFVGDEGSFVYPLAGPELTVAADYTNPDLANLVLRALDFNQVLLASSSQAASAGRVSTSLALPADTYHVEVDLLDGGTATVENVSLRSDGETEFINY